MLTTGFQLAAGRALVGMDQSVLAERSGFSVTTIRNMEKAGAGPIAGRATNVHTVQRALETVGVEFLNHGHPGVRLRWPLIMPLKAVALHVAKFAEQTAWDAGHRPTEHEIAERRDRILAISAEIDRLADASRSGHVRYTDFEALLSKLHELGSFPTNDQVSDVASAFHSLEG